MSAPAIAAYQQITEHAIVIAIPRVVVQTTLYRTAPKTSPPANA
jgi:phage tail protein X